MIVVVAVVAMLAEKTTSVATHCGMYRLQQCECICERRFSIAQGILFNKTHSQKQIVLRVYPIEIVRRKVLVIPVIAYVLLLLSCTIPTATVLRVRTARDDSHRDACFDYDCVVHRGCIPGDTKNV